MGTGGVGGWGRRRRTRNASALCIAARVPNSNPLEKSIRNKHGLVGEEGGRGRMSHVS